jgi:uncharacterized tellurite resistance protein B-like protein
LVEVSEVKRATGSDSTIIGSVLDSSGFGIEPDPRFSVIDPSTVDEVVLYELAEPTTGGNVGDAYYVAAAALGLAVAVSSADDRISRDEEGILKTRLQKELHLSLGERHRLEAWLHWLMAEQPHAHRQLQAAKARLVGLAPQGRTEICQFLTSVAGADGHVHPFEVEFLLRVYKALDLPESLLYTHLDSLGDIKREWEHVELRSTQPRKRAPREAQAPPSPQRDKADLLLNLLFGNEASARS